MAWLYGLVRSRMKRHARKNTARTTSASSDRPIDAERNEKPGGRYSSRRARRYTRTKE